MPDYETVVTLNKYRYKINCTWFEEQGKYFWSVSKKVGRSYAPLENRLPLTVSRLATSLVQNLNNRIRKETE